MLMESVACLVSSQRHWACYGKNKKHMTSPIRRNGEDRHWIGRKMGKVYASVSSFERQCMYLCAILSVNGKSPAVVT